VDDRKMPFIRIIDMRLEAHGGEAPSIISEKLRAADYQTLVQNTLENISCQTHYTSLIEEVNYSRQDRFWDIRQQEVQPSPPVHYHFLMERILPNTSIEFDPARAQRLEQLILDQTWRAYDPNRAQIWQELTQRL
jgi:hypothetical protein